MQLQISQAGGQGPQHQRPIALKRGPKKDAQIAVWGDEGFQGHNASGQVCGQKGIIMGVILNGAKRSEESRFFAALRMTMLIV